MFNQSYDDVSDKFVYWVCTGPRTRKILEFDFYIKVKFGVMKKIDLSPGKVLEICL